MASECNKVKYYTRKAAKAALKKTKRSGGRAHDRHETAMYRCPICDYFHLTSQEQDWKRDRDRQEALLNVQRD